MNRTDFLATFQELLQRESPLDFSMTLADISEWDSLAAMLVIAYAEKSFGRKLFMENFHGLLTVEDLYQLFQA